MEDRRAGRDGRLHGENAKKQVSFIMFLVFSVHSGAILDK